MEQSAELGKTSIQEAKLIFSVFECCHVLGGIASGGVSIFGCDKFSRGSSERSVAFC